MPWADAYSVRSASVVSRVVAGLILWPARSSSGVICRWAVAMVPVETPNSSARTGLGTARRCRRMVTRVFSARVSACGWPPGSPPRCGAAARDVPFGFALGLVGKGQRGGELVPFGCGHAGQGGRRPAGAFAAARPWLGRWRGGWSPWIKGVVPVAVPVVAAEGQRGHLLVADRGAGRVAPGAELRSDAQPGAGSSRCDGRHDDLMAGQGPASPVHGDVGEQPVLDLVPFRGAGREVARGDLQAGLEGKCGQLMLPGPGAGVVRAARVRGDQQPPGARIGGAARVVPPAADRLHGEGGGVMVGADVHPARVGRQVVDPVRDGLAQLQVGEVVALDPGRLAGRPPFPAAVVVVADQLLLLGVHADHRLPSIPVLPDLLIEVAELRIPVRDLVTLDGLGVALQAEALL